MQVALIRCNSVQMKSDGHVFQIKYKELYMKNKEKAVGVNMSDSKTLHSLQVAKMSSDVSRNNCSVMKGLRMYVFTHAFIIHKYSIFIHILDMTTVYTQNESYYCYCFRLSTRRAPRRVRPSTAFHWT